MTKEKLIWIDNLKAIGIIAVILGHIASPFGTFIYSWHMPLFFMIAGFFIKFDLTFKDFIIKDFKRLMIPYFIFSFIGVSVEIIKRLLLNRDMLDFKQTIIGITYNMDVEALSGHYGHILWFLPALFFSRLILYLIHKIVNNFFVIFLFVVILFLISFYIKLPFALDESFNAIIWLYFGYIYFNFFKEYNKQLFLISVIIISIIFYFYSIPILDVASKNYENNIINILWGTSIFLFLCFLFMKINFSSKISSLISLWGGNTMLLYIMHAYTNNIAFLAVDKSMSLWYVKLLISIFLLHIILVMKIKFNGKGIFRFV